ncbi:hypothetical protein OHR68_33085 [Spirillospora sp. NBC_00431]
MPTTMTIIALTTGAAAVAAGAVLAVPALATGTTQTTGQTTGTAQADSRAQAPPLAGIMGKIDANGKIRYTKNIVSVSKPRRGVYCLRVRKNNITRTAPQGTAVNYARVVSIIAGSHPQCGNRTDTYRVSVYNAETHKTQDSAFYITVP